MKKQKTDPFFIAFANLDLAPKETHGKSLDPKQWRNHLKAALQNAKQHDKDHQKNLEILIDQLPRIDPAEILKSWIQINELLGHIIVYPDSSDRIRSFERYANKILSKTSPSLSWDPKKDTFSFGVSPLKGNIIYYIYFEMAQFLVNNYKKGIFSRCALEDCNKIITTSNGQKYCSRAHVKKTYDQSIEKNARKANRQKISNRLNKEYHRKLKAGSFSKKKYPTFSHYKEAHWPTDELDLLELQ